MKKDLAIAGDFAGLVEHDIRNHEARLSAQGFLELTLQDDHFCQDGFVCSQPEGGTPSRKLDVSPALASSPSGRFLAESCPQFSSAC